MFRKSEVLLCEAGHNDGARSQQETTGRARWQLLAGVRRLQRGYQLCRAGHGPFADEAAADIGSWSAVGQRAVRQPLMAGFVRTSERKPSGCIFRNGMVDGRGRLRQLPHVAGRLVQASNPDAKSPRSPGPARAHQAVPRTPESGPFQLEPASRDATSYPDRSLTSPDEPGSGSAPPAAAEPPSGLDGSSGA